MDRRSRVVHIRVNPRASAVPDRDWDRVKRPGTAGVWRGGQQARGLSKPQKKFGRGGSLQSRAVLVMCKKGVASAGAFVSRAPRGEYRTIPRLSFSPGRCHPHSRTSPWPTDPRIGKSWTRPPKRAASLAKAACFYGGQGRDAGSQVESQPTKPRPLFPPARGQWPLTGRGRVSDWLGRRLEAFTARRPRTTARAALTPALNHDETQRVSEVNDAQSDSAWRIFAEGAA